MSSRTPKDRILSQSLNHTDSSAVTDHGLTYDDLAKANARLAEDLKQERSRREMILNLLVEQKAKESEEAVHASNELRKLRSLQLGVESSDNRLQLYVDTQKRDGGQTRPASGPAEHQAISSYDVASVYQAALTHNILLSQEKVSALVLTMAKQMGGGAARAADRCFDDQINYSPSQLELFEKEFGNTSDPVSTQKQMHEESSSGSRTQGHIVEDGSPERSGSKDEKMNSEDKECLRVDVHGARPTELVPNLSTSTTSPGLVKLTNLLSAFITQAQSQPRSHESSSEQQAHQQPEPVRPNLVSPLLKDQELIGQATARTTTQLKSSKPTKMDDEHQSELVDVYFKYGLTDYIVKGRRGSVVERFGIKKIAGAETAHSDKVNTLSISNIHHPSRTHDMDPGGNCQLNPLAREFQPITVHENGSTPGLPNVAPTHLPSMHKRQRQITNNEKSIEQSSLEVGTGSKDSSTHDMSDFLAKCRSPPHEIEAAINDTLKATLEKTESLSDQASDDLDDQELPEHVFLDFGNDENKGRDHSRNQSDGHPVAQIQAAHEAVSDIIINWKVPAGYTGIDPYEYRSRARGAKGDDLFYEEGIRYQPGPGSKNTYRTAMISGIPDGATLPNIVPAITCGELFSIQLVNIPTVMATCAEHGAAWHKHSLVARVVFLHETSAIKLEKTSHETGLYVKDQHVHVNVVQTPTWPLNDDLEDLIFGDKRASRVLEVHNSISLKKLQGMLKERQDVVTIAAVNQDDVDEFEVECHSIPAAVQVMEHLKRQGLRDVVFGVDPCASSTVES